jgi:hypothetical protein
MPSRDANGKLLSGYQLRLRKQAKESAAKLAAALPPAHEVMASFPIPDIFGAVLEPPADVEAIEAWAAGLNLRGAVGIEGAKESEAPRLLAVVSILRELGKLKDKAARAEKAMKLRRIRLGELVEVNLDCPPFDDPVAIVVWTYLRIAQLAYQAATAENWQPAKSLAAVKALSNSGFLPCNAELKRITERVRNGG